MRKKLLQKRIEELEKLEDFILKEMNSNLKGEDLVNDINCKVLENEELSFEFNGEKAFDDNNIMDQVNTLYDYISYKINVYKKLLGKEN